MQTLVIKTDNRKNATLLANFLESLQYVKSVVLQSGSNDKMLTSEDWTKPGRAATDEEVEHRIYEAENSMEFTFNEAKDHVYKTIEKCQKNPK